MSYCELGVVWVVLVVWVGGVTWVGGWVGGLPAGVDGRVLFLSHPCVGSGRRRPCIERKVGGWVGGWVDFPRVQ